MQLQVYSFFGGYEIADKSMLTLGRDLGVKCKIPFQYFLIDHPSGRMMFDTGFNPAYFANPDSYEPAAKFDSVVQPEDLAINRLRELGIQPEQINLVANSHLHYDHAGGNQCFPNATFLVQWDELQSAMCPEPFSGLVAENYHRPDFDLKVHYELLDGDYDVFRDSSVLLIRTPGHTRGHQSLKIKLPHSGPVVFAQDAVYLRQNLEEMILSPTCWDQRLMYNSFRRLRDLERVEGARVIPGHDIQVYESLPKPPQFLD